MTTPTPERSLLPTTRFDHISDYEQWAGQNWVHTPGSPEAQTHARAKFDEETHELIDAILSGTPEEISSETGDMVRTAVATGSNAGLTVTESLRSALPGYFGPHDPITVKAVDAIALNLFNGINSKTVVGYLRDGERVLGKKANLWFKFSGNVNTPPKTFADAWLKSNRVDAVHALATTILLAGFIAHEYVGKDLGAILDENYQKIEQRLSTGKEVTRSPEPLATA